MSEKLYRYFGRMGVRWKTPFFFGADPFTVGGSWYSTYCRPRANNAAHHAPRRCYYSTYCNILSKTLDLEGVSVPTSFHPLHGEVDSNYVGLYNCIIRSLP